MSKKIIILIAIFLGVALIAAGVVGWISSKSDKQQNHWLRQFEKERLNLSDSQKKEMNQLRLDLQNKIKPLQSKAHQTRIELMELLKDTSPDDNAIRQKQIEISQLQSEMQGLVIDNLLDIKKILKPDQQKILFDVMCMGFCGGNDFGSHGLRDGGCNDH